MYRYYLDLYWNFALFNMPIKTSKMDSSSGYILIDDFNQYEITPKLSVPPDICVKFLSNCERPKFFIRASHL